MSDQISWHVELRIAAEKSNEFRELTAEMVEDARRESGTLTYERYTSDDNTIVHVYEKYADSTAAVEHLRRFHDRFGQRFAILVERKRFAVYGSPNNELRQLLDAFHPDYLELLDGFSTTDPSSSLDNSESDLAAPPDR